MEQFSKFLSKYSRFELTFRAALLALVLGLAAIFLYTYPGVNAPDQSSFSPEPPLVTTPSPGGVTEAPGRGGPALGTPAPSQKVLPAQVLNLENWKLALPLDTSHPGRPDTIVQPELKTYLSRQFFDTTPAGDGVIFRANAGGATTANSHYPRSELREMTGGGSAPASWSDTSGTHTMIIREAITHLPVAKPSLVAGQIHDSKDDVVMIKLDHNRLFVEASSKQIGDLDTNYTLGKVFTVKIVASGGHIKTYYNDQLKSDYTKSGSGYYFKSGCYTQSNISKGDAFNAYGEVIVYGLGVTHT